MPALFDLLTGHRRGSLGSANQAIPIVRANPALIDELFDGIASDDPVLRTAAIHVVEKVTADQPALLAPFKSELLNQVAAIEQWEVRAHLCELIPRLTLTPAERRRIGARVHTWLDSRSSIVKTFALECLFQLNQPIARKSPARREEIARLLVRCATYGDTPALRARARLLLKQFARAIRARTGV